ncbi:MAG: hypothetical protein DLM59_00950 [Pseudonocardiales bacterium]|nr:MAG: hypothetical protein DLM59_00950 [Pseudonocardiales bacterium]
MKLATLRRFRAAALPGVTGVARLDRRTKRITKRLRPGDIAVIDHVDLDRVAADALVSCKVAAVINASPCISGRYPNLGPEVLIRAGVPVLDAVGGKVFEQVSEGQTIRLDGDSVYAGTTLVATGFRHDAESVSAAMVDAKAGLSTQLEAFAANTMEYMRRERDLLLDGVGVPDIKTGIDGRHCLIVVRGYDYRQDLRVLRPYIREFKPVLIGVDGGADALVEAGYRPDLIVGDMDSVTDEVLRCGAEVVVHAYPDGHAPGLARVQDLGVKAHTFPAAATSEDIAMLLADEHGAALIVAVGTHATLIEFLDKGRAGMASTFLTRLRIGGKLIDAKGVSRLYRQRIGAWPLLILVLAAMVSIAAALGVSDVGQSYVTVFTDLWDGLLYWIQGLLH